MSAQGQGFRILPYLWGHFRVKTQTQTHTIQNIYNYCTNLHIFTKV